MITIKQIVPSYIQSYISRTWGIYGARRYATNTIWLFTGQTATILTFAINILLARSLGPQSFGILSYVLAFVGMFGFIAHAGLQETLPRDFLKHAHSQRALIGSSALIIGIGSIVAWFTTIAVTFTLGDSTELKLLIIMYAASYIWMPINTIVSSFFYATVNSKKVALTQASVLITVSIVRLVFLFFTGNLALFIATFAVEPALTALGYYLNSRKIELWHIAMRIDRQLLRNLFVSGSLLMLSGALTYLLLRIDQVMVKTLVDTTAVGYYAAAVRISEMWYFIPGLICTSLLPALVNSRRTNLIQYRSRIRHLYVLLSVVAICIAIIVSMLSYWLITLLYGAAYAPSIPILTIYAWSNIGFFLFIGVNKQLLIEHRHITILIYSVIAVVVNISLNFLLLQHIGVVGAAWATLISYAIIPLLHTLFHRRSTSSVTTST